MFACGLQETLRSREAFGSPRVHRGVALSSIRHPSHPPSHPKHAHTHAHTHPRARNSIILHAAYAQHRAIRKRFCATRRASHHATNIPPRCGQARCRPYVAFGLCCLFGCFRSGTAKSCAAVRRSMRASKPSAFRSTKSVRRFRRSTSGRRSVACNLLHVACNARHGVEYITFAAEVCRSLASWHSHCRLPHSS